MRCCGGVLDVRGLKDLLKVFRGFEGSKVFPLCFDVFGEKREVSVDILRGGYYSREKFVLKVGFRG